MSKLIDYGNRKKIENSSIIVSVDYDDLIGNLIIEFRGTGDYEYPGVPKELYYDLLAADSAGKFFNNHIKSKYAHFKVRPKKKKSEDIIKDSEQESSE